MRAGDLQVLPASQTPHHRCRHRQPVCRHVPEFGKQANVYWYEIYEIVRATCTTDYAGTTPGEEVMEQLLNARS